MTRQRERAHRRLEGKSGLFAILTTIVIFIGGLVEIIPILKTPGMSRAETLGVEPYSPLELAGRDIYIREGCYNCHSQMVRPMRSDTLRFGEWSRSYEYVYDRPFQFGSRRIGPDLHREGGRNNDAWHFDHMRNPRSTSEGSIMPNYEHLYERKVDPEDVSRSLRAMQELGVPYTDDDIANAADALQREGQPIVDRLAQTNAHAEPDDEIVAVIAYLQGLGRNRPLFNDLTGTALGHALYDEFNCQRCHGERGRGGVENPNAEPPTMGSLDDLATRLDLDTSAKAQTAIALLSSHADPADRRDNPPWPGFDEFLTRLDETRDAIRFGRIVQPVDPDGPAPQSMPNFGYRLNDHRIDALIAYLISLHNWRGGEQ